MAETAALVVALSAQITKFEKDMASAVSVANKRTKEIETTFARMNRTIFTQFDTLAFGGAANIGNFASALTRIGPAGVIAASGIGAVVGAIFALATITQRYIKETDKLQDAAELTGLTATQLRELQLAAIAVGASADDVNAFITRLVAGLERFKDGEGELFKNLLKLDQGLVAQLNTAKTTADAINILAAAYRKLDTEAKKIEFSKAIGGKAGLTNRVLGVVPEQGGVQALAAAGKNIDAHAKKIGELNDQLEKLRQDSFNILGGMASEESLQQAIEINEQLKSWNTQIDSFFKKVRDGSFLQSLRNINQAVKAADPKGLPRTFADRFSAVGAGMQTLESFQSPGRTVPTTDQALREQLAPGPLPPLTDAQNLEKLKQAVSVMGDAVTIAEKYRLQLFEISKVRDVIGPEKEARAIEAASAAMATAIQSTRERLGVATEENILQERLAATRRDAEQAELTQTERTKAETIARREAVEVLERQIEKQSRLKGVAQLTNEIKNTDKAFDQFATSGLRAVEEGFVDIVTQTKTVAEAFKAMVDSILKELARMLIRKAIIAPLGDLIQKGFSVTPAPGAAVGGIIGASRFPMGVYPSSAFAGAQHFQGGGSVGGVPIMAHRGEIIGWPNQLKHAFGSDVQINVINNAPGVDVETTKRQEGGITAIDFVINTTNKAAGDGRLDSGLGGRFGARPRTVRR